MRILVLTNLRTSDLTNRNTQGVRDTNQAKAHAEILPRITRGVLHSLRREKIILLQSSINVIYVMYMFNGIL